jgi:hypothetical protein
MFAEAHRDFESRESISTHTYNYHPEVAIEEGDVLTQDKRYIHPALVRPTPQPKVNVRGKGFWQDLIDGLPKVKVGSKK